MTIPGALIWLCALAPGLESIQGSAPRVCGRVLDSRGAPLEGVALALKDDPSSVLARTGAGGAFEMEAHQFPPLRHLVIADGQSLCTAVGAVSGLCGPTGEYLLVGAPAQFLSGRVVDPKGRGIEGAELTASVDASRLLLAFPHPLDSDTLVAPRTRSDSSGKFALQAPDVEGLTLCASSEGCARVRTWIPRHTPGPGEPLVLTLKPCGPHWRGHGVLHGYVLTRDGAPAIGARVDLGNVEATAGEDGGFAADAHRGFRFDDMLCATLPGHQPGLVLDPTNALADLGTETAPVVLTLGGPPLSIEGRVLDHLGNPCAGWLVELVDGTAISPVNRPSLRAERLTAGGPDESHWTTDSSGAFRIDGLMPRTYELQAEPPWPSGYPAVWLRSEPIQAGASGMELRLEREPWIAPFRGRLVNWEGHPLAGVRVALELESSLSWPDSIQSTTTDAAGRFELSYVPKQGARFAIDWQRLPIEVAEDEVVWTLRVASQPNLRFDWLRSAPPPTALEALDAGGSPLPITTFWAGRPHGSARSVSLGGVRSHLLAVHPSATVLRLNLDGGDVEFVELRLEQGTLAELFVR